MMVLGTAQLDTVVDVQIVGSGLCLLAMTTGLVKFYNFITGEDIYTLNTHEVYQFPNKKICEAIEMCARTYYFDLLLENKCDFHHDSHSDDGSDSDSHGVHFGSSSSSLSHSHHH